MLSMFANILHLYQKSPPLQTVSTFHNVTERVHLCKCYPRGKLSILSHPTLRIIMKPIFVSPYIESYFNRKLYTSAIAPLLISSTLTNLITFTYHLGKCYPRFHLFSFPMYSMFACLHLGISPPSASLTATQKFTSSMITPHDPALHCPLLHPLHWNIARRGTDCTSPTPLLAAHPTRASILLAIVHCISFLPAA
jgi:hypothetical protein